MNPPRDNFRRHWRLNFTLTAGVMITVVLALLLAQLDALQARAALEQAGLPIVNIQATAIAVGQVIPLHLDPAGPAPVEEPVVLGPAPDDLNPRPEFITGVSEEGVIFTVCGEVPEGWLLYTVQPGETLASLAAGTQSTAGELTAANCLTNDQLTAGTQLLVPRQPEASLCGPPQWWVRYQVRLGDTVGGLAAARGTTIDEVLRANCRDSLDLQAGQLIFLPPGAQSGAPATVPQPSLTPLPPATEVPTVAPLPTATTNPTQPPPPPPTEPPPTSVPPTSVPPTATPPPPPTEPPPPPPTAPPPTLPPPTSTPEPPPTEPPPTEPPPATDEPPTPEPPPTEPPPE
jgi:LysM repeat protein